MRSYKKVVFLRGLKARAESAKTKSKKSFVNFKKLLRTRKAKLFVLSALFVTIGFFAANATGQYLSYRWLSSACNEVQNQLNAEPILLRDCKCVPALTSPNETLPGTNTSLANTTTGQCTCNCYNTRLGARQEITVVRSQP